MKCAATIAPILVFALLGLLAVSALAAGAALSDDEKAMCQLEGGCLFITRGALDKRMRAAYEAGMRAWVTECKRPMT